MKFAKCGSPCEERGKLIMDYGILRLGPSLTPAASAELIALSTSQESSFFFVGRALKYMSFFRNHFWSGSTKNIGFANLTNTDLSGGYGDLAYVMLCNTLVLWGWSVINPGVSSGGTSNSTILSQWYRTGPGHDLAGIALRPTSFLCPSRRWGRGEPGELAT